MRSRILKIGIYNEPIGTGIGGSENMVAVLAEALAREHQVELLHHILALNGEKFSEVSGTDLSNVRLRYVEPDYNSIQYFRNPWRRYQASLKWHATLSKPYDVFVAVVHEMPPFCHAPKGVLLVLFPMRAAPYLQPSNELLKRSTLRRRIENEYQEWEWRKRMESYQVKMAISDFSRTWTRQRWGINCEIVYPPVGNHFRRVEKENLVLSVGRFAMKGEGHTKKQVEMLTTFRQMEEEGLRGWEYFCVGGLRDSPESHDYFENLCDIGSVCRATLIANIESDKLKSLYERAGIFWHAAGYGEDENAHPELAEHFGISTVEAMAAGCVPVVINKGGQREVVRHGVDGFLWNTLEELKEYTGLLAHDGRMLARMSEAARERAAFFSREEFVKRFQNLLR